MAAPINLTQLRERKPYGVGPDGVRANLLQHELLALIDTAEAAIAHMRGTAGDEHRDRLRASLTRYTT